MKQQEIFGNAEFIGSPEFYVSSENLGVFAIETEMSFGRGVAGAGAGIVFGDDDCRLKNRELNELRVEGENYFAAKLFCENENTLVKICRIGYSKTEKEEILSEYTLTEKTKTYSIRLELLGNRLNVIVNKTLLNEKPLVLNPLGENDVVTFPRMNRCGFWTDGKADVHFEPLRFFFLREPKNQFCEIKGMDFSAGALPVSAPAGEPGKKITFIPDCHSLPMFRRSFTVKKSLRKARLFVTARGIYDLCINGDAVSSEYFAPGASQFDHRLYFQTYDVTERLNVGENAIGLALSGGWWSGSQTFVLGCFNLWGDKESFIASLCLEYEDGTVETVVSDTDNWQYFGEGPFTFSGFFQGERQNGKKLALYQDFSKPDFEALHPEAAALLKAPQIIKPDVIPSYDSCPGFFRPYPALNQNEPDFISADYCPVREYKTFSAISRTEIAPGFWIYDLGQEIAGISKITVHGKAGDVLCVRYAEMLYPDLKNGEYGELVGHLLTANLRDASSTDKYILRGDKDGEVFAQKFTFHGFRYIEISGVEDPPECKDVQGVLLSSIPKITGNLKTNLPLLDKFVSNVAYGQLCNFISIPTDCPQRNERMGWAGDTHVFCKTALFNADLRSFYEKYLLAMRDLQEPDGNLPEIAPVGGGFGGIPYGSALLFIANDLYDFYGDKKILLENYEAAKKYLEYLRSQGLPGADYKCIIDDWLAPEPTNSHLIWNAFYARDCYLAYKFASELGKVEDVVLFHELWQQAKAVFLASFCGRNGLLLKKYRTTGALAISLTYNLIDDKKAASRTAKILAKKVRYNKYKITTGFFCTGMILPALSRYGYKKEAYKMMTNTGFPGWLYPVTQGATTIWERWDSFTKEKGFGGNNNMNSFNHYSFGCVLNWLYEYALGVRQAEGSCGWKKILISPDAFGFEEMEGGFETPLGRIDIRWKKNRYGKLELKYKVPEGVEVIANE